MKAYGYPAIPGIIGGLQGTAKGILDKKYVEAGWAFLSALWATLVLYMSIVL